MSTTLNAVSEINLMPGFDHREIVSHVLAAIHQSKRLRASVAHWRLGLEELGPEITTRLTGNDFLCTVIHLPTDIDKLGEMKGAGANVYRYLFIPNPSQSWTAANSFG